MGNTFVDYVPDLRVFLENGSEWWIEVKPARKLSVLSVKQKLSAASIHFPATNRNFSVITEELIWREPLATNLQTILYHRRGPLLSLADHAEVRFELNKHKPQVFYEVVSLFGRMEAWRLLGLCVIGVDLEEPLVEESQVFLSGGHRHANIFA